uniref:LAM_G_DOMAIN domain-containing protein n=1 Tax=Panagrellus redivivus TaxID=6233 RepID=A0A7E4VPQ2_PANRE
MNYACVFVSLCLRVFADTGFLPLDFDSSPDSQHSQIQFRNGQYNIPLASSGNFQLETWLVRRSGFSFDLKFEFDEYIKHKNAVGALNFTMTSKHGVSIIGLIFDGRMLMLRNAVQNVPLAFISSGQARIKIDKNGHIQGYLKDFGTFEFPNNVIVHKDKFNATHDTLDVSIDWSRLSTPFNLTFPESEIVIGKRFELAPYTPTDSIYSVTYTQEITTDSTDDDNVVEPSTVPPCSTISVWVIVLIVIGTNALTTIVVTYVVSRLVQRRPFFESTPMTPMYPTTNYQRMPTAPPPTAVWYDSETADC